MGLKLKKKKKKKERERGENRCWDSVAELRGEMDPQKPPPKWTRHSGLTIGLINGPPAHIKVDDPRLSRGPTYRYSKQAKQLIAEMLDDMEQRDIIERSTAAWLSPIVLVNKSDGSKRMCLDYRHVNKHRATDVYPLSRLEELVEQTAGHPYYVRHA